MWHRTKALSWSFLSLAPLADFLQSLSQRAARASLHTCKPGDLLSLKQLPVTRGPIGRACPGMWGPKPASCTHQLEPPTAPLFQVCHAAGVLLDRSHRWAPRVGLISSRSASGCPLLCEAFSDPHFYPTPPYLNSLLLKPFQTDYFYMTSSLMTIHLAWCSETSRNSASICWMNQ